MEFDSDFGVSFFKGLAAAKLMSQTDKENSDA